MKKIILILIIGIASLSIIFAYKNLLDKTVSAQYILYTEISQTKIIEFTPEGNPNYVCVVTAGGYAGGISCIPKGK